MSFTFVLNEAPINIQFFDFEGTYLTVSYFKIFCFAVPVSGFYFWQIYSCKLFSSK